MDIIGGIAAASEAIEIARTMRNVQKAYDAVELKAQIVDLMDKLMDIKGALQDARDEKETLLAEVATLHDVAKRREETIIIQGFRMIASKKDPGEPQGFPFCLRCEEVDGRLLSTVSNPSGRGARCPECRSEYIHAPIYAWDSER